MPGIPELLRKPFVPLIESTRGYNLRSLRSDAIAGLTVSVVAVPQSMAYALIAGVPAEYGLYTVIFQCFLGSLFNSQRFLSVGPINTQSLLVAATVRAATAHFDHLSEDQLGQLFVSMALALTLIKGVIQMGFAAARLGVLVKYVSTSVVVGFTAGAGVLIAAGQVAGFLGYSKVQVASERMWPGLIGIWQQTSPRFEQTDWRAVMLGVIAIVIVVVSRRVSRLVPGPLIAVAVTAGMVAAVGWTMDDFLLLKAMEGRLPGPMVPWQGLAYWQLLLSGAFALALLGLMEAYSIGSSIAAKEGQHIDANQELLSQGLTNFITGFFQCIPGSGSFSRSALNYFAGARTCYAGVFNAVFVAVIFLALADYAMYIPMSALAAILFVIAYGLVDYRYFRRTFRYSRHDAAVCVITFLSTLLLPLQYAVFVGVFLNIGMYPQQVSKLRIAEVIAPEDSEQGPFTEHPVTDETGKKQVVFLALEGDLFFPMAQDLSERLTRIEASGARVVILRLTRTFSMDASVLDAIYDFVEKMKHRNGHVVFCGLQAPVREMLDEYGIVRFVGEDNVFLRGSKVLHSSRQALQRARALLVESEADDDAHAKEE